MNIDEAFAQFPSLTTERLLLRQVEQADAEPFYAIKSDFEVTRHYGQEPHKSLDQTREWIQRLQKNYALREAIFWCLTLKDQETVIGGCTFWNISPDDYCAEIGYELQPSFWRQGFMVEAVTTILSFGFNEMGLHRIEANPLAGNTASVNILLKLGFTYEGNLRQRVFFRGHFEDQLYYGLLEDEWSRSKQPGGIPGQD